MHLSQVDEARTDPNGAVLYLRSVRRQIDTEIPKADGIDIERLTQPDQRGLGVIGARPQREALQRFLARRAVHDNHVCAAKFAHQGLCDALSYPIEVAVRGAIVKLQD